MKKLIKIIMEMILTTIILVVCTPVQVVLVTRDLINCVMKTILFLIGYTPKYVMLAEDLFKLRDRIDGFALNGIERYKDAMKGELLISKKEIEEKEGR